MTKNKYDTFKEIFLQRQKDILSSHAHKADEIDIDGGDEVDIVQGALIKAMMDKLSARDKDVLHKIRSALVKIEDGTFGACEECGEAISDKRLEIIPYVSHCIECAEVLERRSKQYRV